ncbi:MAG: 50S ribosomal protein L9 [Deltaproteobacteria bacterium]|nr:MAG: 50S ribosomal protein L9 [Deltaproteobacteria bacterium]
MEIILTEDVPNLGSMGDLVKVKPGYGRNYLIPRGFAVLATRGNRRHLDHVMRQIEDRKAKLRVGAEAKAGALRDTAITIARQAGDDDRLFGSVTNRDIEAALEALGHPIERRRILVKEPIKTLGIYHIPLKLHADVTVNLPVWVCAL